MDFERMRQVMTQHGLDALVASSPANVVYTAGVNIITQRVFRDRLALVVCPLEGDPILIVCNIEESLARSDSRIADIRSYVEFKEHPVDLLVSTLTEKGLHKKRLGVELNQLTYRQGDRLLRALPDATVMSAEPVFEQLRAIKTPREIDILRAAAQGTHRAIERVLRSAAIGQTEKSVADAITMAILREGATEPAFNVLSSGARTLQAHPFADQRPLRSGDILKLDAGGLHHGYYSDEAYTALIGDVSPRKLSTFHRVADIHRQVIMAARPGVRANDLFRLCAQLCERANLPFGMPHIGHSMGVELHEWPMLAPGSDNRLEPNMVINIEPIVLDVEDGAGYHFEDLILITAGEPEVLTGSDLSGDPIIIR